jgi:hypothetical protein
LQNYVEVILIAHGRQSITPWRQANTATSRLRRSPSASCATSRS